MASGELSPWAPGASVPSADPYVGSYDGPWAPAPPGPAGWTGSAPGAPGHPQGLTDDQLRQLPPPVDPARLAAASPGAATDQRPALVGLATTLAVAGSLLWVCGLSLFGVVALAGIDAMSPVGDDGVVFHALDEFVLRMGDGLWVPLYGFPVASVVTGFLLLTRRPWARVAHSAVGVVALGWAAWWLRDTLLGWFVVAVYVTTAVAVLWVPSVGRWYAARPGTARRPTHHP